jgi:regulator of telomere elongation helicase 1
MPYNYLIDEKIRENFEISYANSILIFDEAHNVASSAEDVTSFELKAKHLDQCLTEIHTLQEQRS